MKCNPSITVSIEPTQEFRDVLKGAVDGLQPIADRIDALEQFQRDANAWMDEHWELHGKKPAAPDVCCAWWQDTKVLCEPHVMYNPALGEERLPIRFCPNCGARKEAK